MKSYTSRSNAKRAAIKEIAKGENLATDIIRGEFADYATIEDHPDGGFFWRRIQVASKGQAPITGNAVETEENDCRREMAFTEAGDAVPAEDKELVDELGTANCPHCGIHLSNGVMDNISHFEEVRDGSLVLMGVEKNEAIEDALSATKRYTCLACNEEFGEEISLSLNKSVVENPCALVWELAEKLKGERRKDILAACVARGVNYNTARTQYQSWFKHSKAGE